jgi:hypothetical protein
VLGEGVAKLFDLAIFWAEPTPFTDAMCFVEGNAEQSSGEIGLL